MIASPNYQWGNRQDGELSQKTTEITSLTRPVRLAGGWCWFVLREEYCWLVAAGCWWLIRSERKVLLAGG
jgi:hypothetical protein